MEEHQNKDHNHIPLLRKSVVGSFLEDEKYEYAAISEADPISPFNIKLTKYDNKDINKDLSSGVDVQANSSDSNHSSGPLSLTDCKDVEDKSELLPNKYAHIEAQILDKQHYDIPQKNIKALDPCSSKSVDEVPNIGDLETASSDKPCCFQPAKIPSLVVLSEINQKSRSPSEDVVYLDEIESEVPTKRHRKSSPSVDEYNQEHTAAQHWISHQQFQTLYSEMKNQLEQIQVKYDAKQIQNGELQSKFDAQQLQINDLQVQINDLQVQLNNKQLQLDTHQGHHDMQQDQNQTNQVQFDDHQHQLDAHEIHMERNDARIKSIQQNVTPFTKETATMSNQMPVSRIQSKVVNELDSQHRYLDSSMGSAVHTTDELSEAPCTSATCQQANIRFLLTLVKRIEALEDKSDAS